MPQAVYNLASNRFLAKKWEEQRHAKHLKKLKEMKPAIVNCLKSHNLTYCALKLSNNSIKTLHENLDNCETDNRAPIGFGASIHDEQERARKDLKRAIKEGDRKKKIEVGNKKILAKINAIKQQSAAEWKKKVSIVKKSPFNPFMEKRMKEQKRIQAENEKLLQKIEMVKTRTSYDRSKLVREYERKKKAIAHRSMQFSEKKLSLAPIDTKFGPASRSSVNSRVHSQRNSKMNIHASVLEHQQKHQSHNASEQAKNAIRLLANNAPTPSVNSKKIVRKKIQILKKPVVIRPILEKKPITNTNNTPNAGKIKDTFSLQKKNHLSPLERKIVSNTSKPSSSSKIESTPTSQIKQTTTSDPIVYTKEIIESEPNKSVNNSVKDIAISKSQSQKESLALVSKADSQKEINIKAESQKELQTASKLASQTNLHQSKTPSKTNLQSKAASQNELQTASKPASQTNLHQSKTPSKTNLQSKAASQNELHASIKLGSQSNVQEKLGSQSNIQPQPRSQPGSQRDLQAKSGSVKELQEQAATSLKDLQQQEQEPAVTSSSKTNPQSQSGSQKELQTVAVA